MCTAEYALASTPGRIFTFTSDLAKIRPGIDCMLENMPLSLTNRAHEVSLAFQLIKLLQTCLNFQRQWSSLATRVIKSSWLNTEAKVVIKIVFTLVAYVFRLASTSTHLFGLRIETAVIFQPNS